ncbi:MAG: 16S rRNA methyltransferase [Treponema sp.]|jgi:16S rRNA (cytosine1407-C5)-methyltransferase|nr:16S rRNA methyltransferase [Treponema sp.]
MQQIPALINNDFENYYLSIYGERWPLLRESLLLPAKPEPFKHGLLKPYMMDRASVIAASTLRLPRNGVILDACAAPGGKSLVLATLMRTENSLVANEFSAARRNRLRMVLDEYLDTATRQRIKISGFDAAKLGRKKTETYDAILLDVPCSSERHVIQDQKALAQWTPARPRFLSQRQWSLLSASFLILKDGGSLIYSTCAITPEENDAVVFRLLQKYGSQVLIDEPDFVEGEETKYGKIILPDQCDGMGPMYVARFGKKVI